MLLAVVDASMAEHLFYQHDDSHDAKTRYSDCQLKKWSLCVRFEECCIGMVWSHRLHDVDLGVGETCVSASLVLNPKACAIKSTTFLLPS